MAAPAVSRRAQHGSVTEKVISPLNRLGPIVIVVARVASCGSFSFTTTYLSRPSHEQADTTRVLEPGISLISVPAHSRILRTHDSLPGVFKG